MTTLYFRPPDGSLARATALTPWSTGLLLPLWTNPEAWAFNGSGLAATAVSGASGYGYAAAATDAASGAWLCPYNGSLAALSSGGAATAYALPSSRIFTGCAYSPGQGGVYVVDCSGTLYAPSGSGAVQLASGFGSPPAWGLAASGSTLYTLLAAASGLGTFTLSSSAAGASGFVATPMATPSCLAAASGCVGVGGWTRATLASGFSDLAVDPAVPSNLLGATPSANLISLWVDGAGENWAWSQAITGYGAPTRVAWFPSGVGAFVTDPTSGQATALAYSVGTISISQSVPVSAAGAVAVTPNSLAALVCQPALGRVTPLAYTASWASGTPVTGLASAQSVLALTSATAVVGFASGVAFLSASGTVWTVSSTAALPFAPEALAQDSGGNVYAAGSQGASGYLSVLASGAVSATVSWAGAASGILWRQGQIVVGDPSSTLLRVFGLTGGAYVQGGSIAAPPGVDAIAIGTQSLFAAASGTTWQYQFTAPYTLDYMRYGYASVYVSGSWNTAGFGVSHRPAALAFDASGNLWVGTIQNDLYAVSATGGIVSSGSVPQEAPQPQTTDIGLSWMTWWQGHLYAASSLAGVLIRVA